MGNVIIWILFLWLQIRLPFRDFKPVLKGKTVFDGSKLNTTNIVSLQVLSAVNRVSFESVESVSPL